MTHTNQHGMYKLDLINMRYTRTVNLVSYNCVPTSMEFSDLCNIFLIISTLLKFPFRFIIFRLRSLPFAPSAWTQWDSVSRWFCDTGMRGADHRSTDRPSTIRLSYWQRSRSQTEHPGKTRDFSRFQIPGYSRQTKHRCHSRGAGDTT